MSADDQKPPSKLTEKKAPIKGFTKYRNLDATKRKNQRKLHLAYYKNEISNSTNPDTRRIRVGGVTYEVPAIKSSWNLVGFIMNFSDLTKNAKLVSAQIASHYNKEYGYAHPSYERLMISTGLSRTAVANAIKAIKDSNEWVIQNGSKGKNNRYYPNVPFLDKSLEDTNG